jgi:chromate transport protein ChrA
VIYFELFWVFARISLISFGGIFGMIPEIERVLVFEKNWVSSEEFLQLYALGQFLPGPNMSFCGLVGFKVAGFLGFGAAFAGIYFVPILLVGLVWNFYTKVRDLSAVKRVEKSLRPVVLGLMVASSLRVFYLSSPGVGVSDFGQKIVNYVFSAVLGLGLLWGLQKTRYLTPFNSIFVFGIIWVFWQGLVTMLRVGT